MRRFGFLLCTLGVGTVLVWVKPFAGEGAGPAQVPATESSPVQRRVSAPAARPAGSARQLLQPYVPAEVERLNAALPAPARQIGYVRVDTRQITAKSSPFWQAAGVGRIELPLPDGRSLAVVIDRSEMLDADRFTSIGHVENEPGSRAVFAYHAGFLSGSIETADHAYAIRPATAEATQIYEVDPVLVPPCGGVRHPTIDAATIIAANARRARQLQAAESAAVTAAAAAPDVTEVQLLMLYTQTVKTTLSGTARTAALQSEFDAATAKVNAELSASQVPARVKLVKIAETQYDEMASDPGKVQDDALTALQKPTDGKMDEIHALRDQVGADIVCLALGRPDSASIGLSFVLDTPSIVNPAASATNPLYAFAVVQYATVAGTDVVPHELGHVFGCAHARGDPGTNGINDGAYSYSYGYRFLGRDGRQYHDIMAYAPGSALSYYSNPRLVVPSPASAAIGVPSGQSGEADCALTIAETAFEVSTYRLQTAAAPAGTLVNVSTRATVGSGDQVLIAGFVIDGAQPKRVLVRGAGPSLAGFGVANVLQNPALHVFSGGRLLAENDDWWLQPSAQDVAAASAQVGAFPFGSGAADAALLLTLAPGAYSAVLDGTGGASGTGLVEVYDVDRAGNHLVNLSTRGYAAKGGEMFGGFSVLGTPGTTKRILIRVLGPTLERAYGVSGAMYDPILELHNAAGDLLIKNDDWSAGDVADTFSAENDFSPAVRTYSERQIAASGFAPSNRREPCVMLDLAPGNYTVIAQPFESLSGTVPQPAQPGVALIEVYELTK